MALHCTAHARQEDIGFTTQVLCPAFFHLIRLYSERAPWSHHIIPASLITHNRACLFDVFGILQSQGLQSQDPGELFTHALLLVVRKNYLGLTDTYCMWYVYYPLVSQKIRNKSVSPNHFPFPCYSLTPGSSSTSQTDALSR